MDTAFTMSFLHLKNLVASVLVFAHSPIDEGDQSFFTGL
ncbi:hypothetical protein B4113_2326 [Geobacillus sp. B4113_201601]|nr:hypothetical protein B4113_2326 [Geobacillus sp. B4113_201601]